MIKFNSPTNLNGSQLLTELNDANVKITKPPFLDGNNDLWLDIDAKDEVKAKTIINAHNGITVAPDKSAVKSALLNKLGITAEEATLLFS